MKQILWALGTVLGLSAALALGNPHPSLAVRGGYAGGAAFGLEASWNCLLFQPPLGALRPTLDLGYAGGGLDAAFGMRYLASLPLLEGLRAGGGAGVGHAGGFYGFLRADAEFDLDVGTLPLPAFLGLDAGYAFNLEKDAFKGPFAALKLGLRF